MVISTNCMVSRFQLTKQPIVQRSTPNKVITRTKDCYQPGLLLLHFLSKLLHTLFLITSSYFSLKKISTKTSLLHCSKVSVLHTLFLLLAIFCQISNFMSQKSHKLLFCKTDLCFFVLLILRIFFE